MMPSDLRLRLVTAFALALAISALGHLRGALTALALAALLAALARPGRAMLRRLAHVEGLVALLLLTLPFTTPGAALFALGPLAASAEGLTRAALLAAKITAVALALMALLGAAEPARIGAALAALRLPEPLVRALTLTLRYLAVMRGEAHRLGEAMRARGFAPGTNRHTWRSYGNLIGMLLLRALDRARRIDEAMRARGFSGRFPHAVPARIAPRDWAGAALIAAGAVVALGVDRL